MPGQKSLKGEQHSKSMKKSRKPTHHVRKQDSKPAKDSGKNNGRIKLFFMTWESTGRHFLENASFAFSPEDVRLHIFCSKKTPESALPKQTNWLRCHKSLTESEAAEWIDMTAYIVSLYARVSTATSKPPKSHPESKFEIFLVCGDGEKGAELKALLKANKSDIEIVDGHKCTFFDLFNHVCRSCGLIFNSKIQAVEHDHTTHNFLCHNTQCERSRRGNGFFAREELENHLRAQKFCKFCPSDVFCNDAMHAQHVRNSHKQCPCACQEYYEREEDLFEQYYAKYPLPCLEEPACQGRFKDIETQAFHHKSAHGAKYPYFCMACFKKKKLACLKTAEELLRHARDMKHSSKDFEFAIIPEKMLQGT